MGILRGNEPALAGSWGTRRRRGQKAGDGGGFGRMVIAVACLVSLTVGAVSAENSAQERAESLQLACAARMQDLKAKEAEHLEEVRWEIVPEGLRGVYIGYAPDFTCTVGNDPDSKTARMHYQEVVYEKRGGGTRRAKRAEPKPLEIREVTVILSYQGGVWR